MQKITASAYAPLAVGELIAIHTYDDADKKVHWTLGSVESAPYMEDVEVRLWERQRGVTQHTIDESENVNAESQALIKRIAQAKAELQYSIQSADTLTQELRQRREAILQSIEAANAYVANAKVTMKAAREDVENISDVYWQELKSYRVPPKLVSVLIRSVMLLLSEDEAKTWPQMQRVLREWSFKSRITSYDPQRQLSPERREYILRECVSRPSFAYDKAVQGSSATGPIYYWVLSQLDAGEAQSQREIVEQQKINQQKELHQVLKQIAEQQQRVNEYEALIDNLDEELRTHRRHSDELRARSASSVLRSRQMDAALERYYASFAGFEGKEYLKPAFFEWKPTSRTIIFFRRKVLCNFGNVANNLGSNGDNDVLSSMKDGYLLNESQVKLLDASLMERQAYLAKLDEEDEAERLRRAAAEEQEEERNLLEPSRDSQNEEEKEALPKHPVIINLERIFQGTRWSEVMDKHRQEIIDTFTEEATECLQLTQGALHVTSLELGSLIVKCTVEQFIAESEEESTAAASTRVRQLEEQLNAHPFTRLHELYERVTAEADREAASAQVNKEEEEQEEDDEIPEHQVKFGGEGWNEIMAEHQDEVLEAFFADTCAATSLEKNEIHVINIAVDEDGLTIDYTVSNTSISPLSVKERVDEYPYPLIWELYQRLLGINEEGVTEEVVYQRTFYGNRWEQLLPVHQVAIQDAFVHDTSTLFQVPETNVMVTDIAYDREASQMIISFTINPAPTTQPVVTAAVAEPTTALTESEIDHKTETYTYPSLWSVHDDVVASQLHANYHHVFIGSEWEEVLSSSAPEFHAAFAHDITTYLSSICVTGNEVITSGTTTEQYNMIDTTCVNVKSTDVGENRLLVTFNISQPHLLPSIVSVMESSSKTTSTGAVSIFTILPLPEKAVLQKKLEEEESEVAFTRTLSLYAQVGEGALVSTSNLHYTFMGEKWHEIVRRRHNEVQTAVLSDLSSALHIPSEKLHITNVETSTTTSATEATSTSGQEGTNIIRNALTVHFSIAPNTIRQYRVDYLLDSYAFPLTWNQYAIGPVRPHSNPLRRTFIGDAWESLLNTENGENEVRHAFCTGAARALEVPEHHIRVLSVHVGSLIVDYDVLTPELSDDEIVERLSRDEVFPEMNELYRRHQSREAERQRLAAAAAEEDRKEALQHLPPRFFSGADWKYVVDVDAEAVKSSFALDTADALLTDREAIEVTCVEGNETEGTLMAQYTVLPKCPLSATEIRKRVDNHAYYRLWKLYELHQDKHWPVSSHTIKFEGSAWNYVLKHDRVALEESFIRATSEACGLAPKYIRNVQYTLGSLIIHFELQHPEQYSHEELDDVVQSCPYVEIWELYQKYIAKEPIELNHTIHFFGAAWNAVYTQHRELLTFALETDALHGVQHIISREELDDVPIPPLCVSSLSCNEDEDTLEVTFMLIVPGDVPLPQITSQLSRNDESHYTETWGLYNKVASSLDCTTPQQSIFEGTEWSAIVTSCKNDLHDAFIHDTAQALGLTHAHIEHIVYTVQPESLTIDFTVRHNMKTNEEDLRRGLGECQYNAVWNLYGEYLQKLDDEHEAAERAKEAAAASRSLEHRYNLHFEGSSWPAVVDKYSQGVLEDAIVSDTAYCLHEPEDHITCCCVNTIIEDLPEEEQEYSEEEQQLSNNNNNQKKGNYDHSNAVKNGNALEAEIFVTHSIPCEHNTIQAQLSKHTFPTVWNLYDKTIDSCIFRVKSGNLTRTFNGSVWNELIASSAGENAVKSAFILGASRGLSTSTENVCVLALTAGSLKVSYYVVNPQVSDDAITTCLAHDDHFRELFALHDAFKSANDKTSELLPQVVHVELEEEEEEEEQKADHYASITKSVHTQTEPPPVETTHEEEKEQEEEKDKELLEEEALEDNNNNNNHGLNRNNNYHHKLFAGEKWLQCIRERCDDVMRAFEISTAEALHVNSYAIIIHDLNVNDTEGVEFGYLVDGIEFDVMEAINLTDQSSYASLWAIYNETTLNQQEVYEVNFEEEYWDIVLEYNKQMLTSALERSANTEALPHTSAKVICVNVLRDGQNASRELRVQFEISHSKRISLESIDVLLKECPFEAMWETYNALTCSATLQHEFEGKHWPRRVNEVNDELSDALCSDVSEILNISPELVEVTLLTSFTKDAASTCSGDTSKEHQQKQQQEEEEKKNDKKTEESLLHIEFIVRGAGRTSEEIEEALRTASFTHVWELYFIPAEPVHGQRSFDGEGWEEVLEEKKEEIYDAFARDSGDALGIPKSHIILHSIYYVKDALIIAFEITPPYKSTAETFVANKVLTTIDRYEYPYTWALYYDLRQRSASYREINGVNRLSSVHERVLDGEDWQDVVEHHKDEADEIFRRNVAELLHINPSQVEVCDMVLGSLHIQYRVRGCPMSEGEIEHLVSSHNFDELHALRLRCMIRPANNVQITPNLQNLEPWTEKALKNVREENDEKEKTKVTQPVLAAPIITITTKHNLTFAGDAWPFVIIHRNDALHNALLSDIVFALHSSPEQINHLTFHVEDEPSTNNTNDNVEKELNVDFYVIHEIDCMEETIDEALRNFDFAQVWSLYCPPNEAPYGSCEFSHNAAWNNFVREHNDADEQIGRAFKSDVARELDYNPSDIVIDEVYYVLHKAQQMESNESNSGNSLNGDRKERKSYNDIITTIKPDQVNSTTPNEKNTCDGVVVKYRVYFSHITEQELNSKIHEAVCINTLHLLDPYNLPEPKEEQLQYERKPTENRRVSVTSDTPGVTSILPKDVLRKSFVGNKWIFVMVHYPHELQRALRNDTAAALNLNNAEDVVIRSKTANKVTGMQIEFVIHELPKKLSPFLAKPTKKTTVVENKHMIEKVDKYEYHETWSLYSIALANTDKLDKITSITEDNINKDDTNKNLQTRTLIRVLDGEDWHDVLEHHKDEADEIFRRNVAELLHINPSQVEVCDMVLGSLHIQYRVRGCPMSEGEIEHLVSSHNFDELHALRHRVNVIPRNADGTAPSSSSTLQQAFVNTYSVSENNAISEEVSSSEIVQDFYIPLLAEFEGEHWEFVVDSHKDEFADAFLTDTAQVLHVARDEITINSCESNNSDEVNGVTALELVVFTLHVHNTVKPNATALQNIIHDCLYEQVWNLYAVCCDEEITTPHTIHFNGENWRDVEQNAHDALISACRSEIATICAVDEGNVNNIVLECTEDQMKVLFDVEHKATLSSDQINAALDVCAFEEVWSLYDCVISENTISNIDKELNELMHTEPPKESEEYEGKEVIIVDVQQQEEQEESESITQEQSSTSQLRAGIAIHNIFEGEMWNSVLLRAKETIQEAFVIDMSNCLGIDNNNIEVLDMYVGSLHIDYCIHSPPATLTKAEVQRRSATYGYPTLWSVYLTECALVEADKSHSPESSEFTLDHTSANQVNKEELEQQANTAQKGVDEIPSSDMDKKQLSTSHWYAVQDGECSNKEVLSRHELTFGGRDWKYTMQQNGTVVINTLQSALMELLQVPMPSSSSINNENKETQTSQEEEEEELTGLVVQPEEEYLLASFTLRHSSSVSTSEINQLLRSAAFLPVWALYQPRPFTSNDASSTNQNNATKQRIIVFTNTTESENSNISANNELLVRQEFVFEGNGWTYTLSHKVANIRQAFVNDVCDKVNIPAESVCINMICLERDGSMVIDATCHIPITVMCSVRESMNTLYNLPFTNVWSLYETQPGAAYPVISNVQVSARPSAAVSTNRNIINNMENEANYGVNNKSSVLNNFKPVPLTTYRLEYDGDAWRRVVENCSIELVEAIKTDIANLLHISPDVIKGVSVEALPSSLKANIMVATESEIKLYDEAHPMSMDDADVQASTKMAQMLAEYPYPYLWELYNTEADVSARRSISSRFETQPPIAINSKQVSYVGGSNNSNSHVENKSQSNLLQQEEEELPDEKAVASKPVLFLVKRFDGTDWDLAIHAYPDIIKERFVHDTSSVLQCSARDITIDAMTLGSLIFQFRVQECNLSTARAQEMINDYAYPSVWSLYKPRYVQEVVMISPKPTSANGVSTRATNPLEAHGEATDNNTSSSLPLANGTAKPELIQENVEEEEEEEINTSENDGVENDEDTVLARERAASAQRDAEAAQAAKEESARKARKAEEDEQIASAEAEKIQQDALANIKRAMEKKEQAAAEASAARAEAQRNAAEALARAERAVEAAKVAQEAAEEARRKRVKPLGKREMANEEESIVYLRKALAKARKERDYYLAEYEKTVRVSTKQVERTEEWEIEKEEFIKQLYFEQ